MTNQKNYTDTVRASVQGHRFHWYIGAQEALAMVRPGSSLRKLHIEGRAENAGAHEEIADILRERETDNGGVALEYVQIKHSTARMKTPIRWADLKPTLLKFAALDDQNALEESQSYEYLTNRSLSKTWRNFFDAPAVSTGKRHPWSLLKVALTADKIRWTDTRIFEFLSRLTLSDRRPDVAALRRDLESSTRMLAPGRGAKSVVDHLFVLVSSAASSDPSRPVLLNRELVLNAFDVEYVEDLFPCPAHFVPIQGLLHRPEIDRAVEVLVSAYAPPTLLVAPGGVGKTVLMQQISETLHNDHHVILFDCFANGTYRNLEDLRHRPARALMQIVNELAFARLCPPLLRLDGDGPTVLGTIRRRFAMAAAALKERNGETAKIILLIDAADNSAEFARDRGEDDFASWLFSSLTDQPIAGVSLAMSCRDYRVKIVTDQTDPSRIDIQPFDREMTDTYLSHRRPDLGDNARTALWGLSEGNPRVLDYLLRTDFKRESDAPVPAIEDVEKVSVDDVIANRVNFAMSRLSMAGATSDETNLFLAALVRLPPPIPLSSLTVLTGISQARLESFITDLTPLLSRSADGLTFRDEPAQSWARRQIEDTVHAVSDLVAKLEATQDRSIYIAKALPVLLAELGRTADLLDLAQSTAFPAALTSPAAQQSLRLVRIREALRGCAQDGLIADCVQLLYTLAMVRGVETRTDNFIANWPALAAMSQQSDARRRLHTMTFEWRGERAGYLAQTALVQDRPIVAANDLRKFRESLSIKPDRVRLDSESVSALVVAAMKNEDWTGALQMASRATPATFRISVLTDALQLARLSSIPTEPLFKTYLDMMRNNAFDKSGESLGLSLGLFLDPLHDVGNDKRLCFLAAREIEILQQQIPQQAADQLHQPSPLNGWGARAARKALSMGRRTDAKRFLSVTSPNDAHLYHFHDDFGRHELLSFFRDRCIRVAVLPREPRLSDFLPSEIRRLKHIIDAPDGQSLTRVLKARHEAARPARTSGHKASRRPTRRRDTVFSSLDDGKIGKVVARAETLLNAATSLIHGWAGDNSDKVQVLQTALDQRQSTSIRAYDQDSQARRTLRDGLILFLADCLVPFAPSPDPVWASLTLPNADDHGLLFAGTQWLCILTRRPSWHANAGQIATELAERHFETTDMDARVEDLAQLANAIAVIDQSHAKTLIDSILETMDGISSDDHAMFNNIVRLAGRQRGGFVSGRIANRFFNFAEVMLSQDDRLPWPTIGETCNSFGFQLMARISDWDAKRKVRLGQSLSLGLPAHIRAGLISHEIAYALFALSECGYWQGDRPSLVAGEIYAGLTPKHQTQAYRDLATQISVDDSLCEMQSFVSVVGEQLPISLPEVGMGHWPAIKPGDQPDKVDWMPTRSLDRDVKPAVAPDVELPSTGMDVTTLQTLLSVLEPAPIDKLSPLIAWATANCHGENRERFVDLLFQSVESSSYVTIRVANAVCDFWQTQSPQFRTRRKCWARDYIDARIMVLGRGDFGSIMSTLHDLALFVGEPLENLAFHALSAIVRNDGYISKEEAFAFADALLDQATPEVTHATLCQLVSSNTFDTHPSIGKGIDEGEEAPATADTAKSAAALIWAQLGSAHVSARWRAGHAVARLAATEQTHVLTALVDQFTSRPQVGMFPADMRFPLGTAQMSLLNALERSARLSPDTIRPMRDWLLSLVEGKIPNACVVRAAGNAVAYVDSPGNPAPDGLNLYPISPFPYAPRVGSAWGGFPKKTKLPSDERFYLEYEFQKHEPERAARPFADFSLFPAHPESLIIAEALTLDPHLDSMHDLGGAPTLHNAYHERRSGQIEVYGEMRVHEALQRKAYEWHQSYAIELPTDHWMREEYGDSWEYWFKNFRPSSGRGVWLADRTFRPPAFIDISSRVQVDELEFGSVEPLLDALGWAPALDKGIVIAGSWSQTDGTSISLTSVATRNWGSKKASRSLARGDWRDLYLPISPMDNHVRSDFESRFENGLAWIQVSDSDIMNDRFDPFGCSAAGRLSEFDPDIARHLGLERHDNGFLRWEKDGDIVALSVAWGRDDRSEHGDRDTTGNALIVSRKWLKTILNTQKRALVATLRRTTSKLEYSPRRRTAYRAMKHVVCLDTSLSRQSWGRRPPKGDYYY